MLCGEGRGDPLPSVHGDGMEERGRTVAEQLREGGVLEGAVQVVDVAEADIAWAVVMPRRVELGNWVRLGSGGAACQCSRRRRGRRCPVPPLFS